MLSGPRASTPEAGLHLTLAARPCHALPTLLTTETPERVTPADIPAVDNRRNNEQNKDQQPREGDCGQNAVDKAAKDPADG